MSDYGLGGLQSPPDERDWQIEDYYAASGLASAVVLPAKHLVPNRPPVLNQKNTPQCTAFSTSAMKSYQDRDDQSVAKFWNFDEPTFFRAIGGTWQGAYLRTAMDRLLKVGYPVVTLGQASKHKIKAYYAVPTTKTEVKTAVFQLGIAVMAIPWYNSWMRPTSTGILPRPDWQIGGHAIAIDGWDDAKGLRLRNSWGPGWGLDGDCFLPYSYMAAIWEIFKSVDT